MNQENLSNEVNLLELFNVLRRYKKLLLGLPLMGAVLAALLVSFVLRPTWEASVVLEVGRVGQPANTAPILAEPVGNVVTRMMLPSFARGAINYAGIKSEELKTMQGFYGTLKVSQVKGTELIEVKLRGLSAEMAKNLIQGVISNLQKVHSEMMAATIERNKKQLQMLTEDISKTDAETKLLRQQLLASHNWNNFDATLTASILQNKNNDLRGLIQAKLVLEEQLTPSHTYTTRVVDEIYVSDEPVSPKKGLIIGLAVLLGLFGAVVIAFAHNAFTS